MTVGGGVLFEQIFDPLFNAGMEMRRCLQTVNENTATEPDTATGACPCVGLMGPALAGGLARYEGIHGLIGDSLLSVRMVSGRGEIVAASRAQNPDLFWGIRGAGQNFGIVTEAVFRIYDLTASNIVNADYIFSGDKVEGFYEAMRSLSTKMPAELNLLTLMFYDNVFNEVS